MNDVHRKKRMWYLCTSNSVADKPRVTFATSGTLRIMREQQSRAKIEFVTAHLWQISAFIQQRDSLQRRFKPLARKGRSQYSSRFFVGWQKQVWRVKRYGNVMIKESKKKKGSSESVCFDCFPRCRCEKKTQNLYWLMPRKICDLSKNRV